MDKVAAAKSVVPAISTAEAAELLGRDDVLFVDVRDAEEVASSGKILGALNVFRGMLEFRADDRTPYHNPAFSRDKTIVSLLCLRRPLRPRRQGSHGHGLCRCAQPGGLQALGG